MQQGDQRGPPRRAQTVSPSGFNAEDHHRGVRHAQSSHPLGNPGEAVPLAPPIDSYPLPGAAEYRRSPPSSFYHAQGQAPPTGSHPPQSQRGYSSYSQHSQTQSQYGGEDQGRPLSDDVGAGFDRLSITSHDQVNNGNVGQAYPLYRQPSSMSNSSGYARSNSAGPGYQPQQQAQGGYPASVYSVDRGYTPGMDPVYESEPGRRGSQEDGNGMGMGPGMGSGMGFTPANPYLAASDHLGLAPPPSGPGPSRARTLRNVSSTSDVSTLHRTPTTSIGSSKAKRKGISAAIDVTKPPYTKEFVDDYRARMKMDPDPEAQFAFARYLIEAARKIGEDMSATDPRAGKRYRDGLLAESLKNLKRLAAEGGAGKGEGGYPEAQFFLANMFGTGQLGLQVDHEKAYQLYMQASKANHPAATYRTAVCNELGAGTRKEMNRAVLFYRKAAALKDTAAMYKLAMILLMGSMGQARNPNEGVVWLRRAASQADEDNPHALHELAMIYEDPRALKLPPNICPPSIEAAREHYTEAAQLGYAPSMYKLGVAYEHGHLGCPVDPRRSIAWLSRAAEKGDPEAALALSGWFLTGAEGVLKQDDQEAFLWARKAANKGLPKAEFALGHYIEAGIGVPQNLEMAKHWYQRAATSGSEQAKKRIEDLAKRKRPAGRPSRQEAKAEGCVIA